jgi:hypothetical protein
MHPLADSNKRRFYRHPVSVPIEYQEKQIRPGRSSSVDLSEGGICFLAERFIAKGSPINLKIPVGDQMFTIEGQVAYSNRLPTLNRFKTGVAFTNPTHAFRAKLVEEMVQMKLFREKLSREQGREVTEDEAARTWVEKYAKQFGELF